LPVFNEEHSIRRCLDSILGQDYNNIIEILVIDGGSNDRTAEIVSVYAGKDLRIKLLENPRRVQACAMNIAIDKARGSILVRVDGHSILDTDYVSNAVSVLEKSSASVVGGAISPVGIGWKSEGIGAAMNSKIGSGPATFHNPDAPAHFVDTVYLGVFAMDDLKAVGGYDESFVANEDAELNYRLSELNGVYFDSSIKSSYLPRDSFQSLGRQYFRYGRYRAKTMLKHPNSISPRQLAPPLLIFALLYKKRLSVAGAYILFIFLGALIGPIRKPRAIAGYLVAVPIMHFCWGIGLIFGLIRELINEILPTRVQLQ
jgi:glycosyltransferase involved in cell wall biosynthesis